MAALTSTLVCAPAELDINHLSDFYNQGLDIGENSHWSHYMHVSKRDHKMYQLSATDITLPRDGDEFKAVCLFLRQVIEYNVRNPQSLLLREKVFLKINGEKINEMIQRKNESLSWFRCRCRRASIKRLPVEKLSVDNLWMNDKTPMGRFFNQYGKSFVGHSIINVEVALKDGHVRSDFNPNHIEKAIASVRGTVITVWNALLEAIRVDTLERSETRSSMMLALERLAKEHQVSRVDLIRYCDLMYGSVDAKLTSISKVLQQMPDRADIDKCKAHLFDLKVEIFELHNPTNNCSSIRSQLARGSANQLELRNSKVGVLKSNIRSDYNLPAWQNNGKNYSINLKAEDVLIVGPRAILEEYTKTYSNIVYIEDLTFRQRDYLFSSASDRQE